ncbi:GLUG motif-containing protein [Intestinimonas massiliensis (ex Afouda et al. 2020)]|uniref:GLUG motif-containing protein n=1 Tax=Intestinimonas massiliensis (ex Afouda et al. 2020) TaxID=1673721 RepID=UPI0010319649|nr:GLUG motif-containing protein [Intestinimonas massiliensis (ex Afouda et al. 2020)]
MRHRNKGLSALLTAVLLLQLLAPAAWAAEPAVITIRTAEDLTELSRNCSLDSWSQGKTVRLTADIDLAGTSFQAIPTFGGTFDGGGHTISGLSFTGSGNVQGLFRYLQSGGVVKDLTVTGNVSPTDFRDTIGGIVGDNKGEVLRCTFEGTVSGKTTVGGVVGCNQAGGQVINCTFSGSVSGELHVGGIVGQNLGSVIQCTNRGSVNTTELDTEADPQTLLQEETVTDAAADLSGWTDVGGVAGHSTGILQNCRNEGAVGYPHVGYNIGGIAGRQNGFLDGCTNTGTVQGRKDVGGIVGQLEPEVTLLYQKSFLEQLGGELDVLQNKMDGLLNDAGAVSDDLSAQMRSLSDNTRTARDAVKGLSDAMVDWTEEGVGQINDLSARISRALEGLTPILDDADTQLTALGDVADQFSAALEEAAKLGQLSGDGAEDLRLAVKDAAAAARDLKEARTHIAAALDALKKGLGDEQAMSSALNSLSQGVRDMSTALTSLGTAAEQIRSALQRLWADKSDQQAVQQLLAALTDMSEAARQGGEGLTQAVKALSALQQAILTGNPAEGVKQALEQLKSAGSDASQALAGLAGGAGHLADAMESLKKLSGVLDGSLSGLGKAGREVADVLSSLADSAGQVQQVVQELTDGPSIQVPSLDTAVTQQSDALSDAFSGLMDGADDLNTLISNSTDTLLTDLQAINAQLGVISSLVRNEGQRMGETQMEDRVQDVSAMQEIQSQSTGRVSACRNEGAVEGDVDVAGIAGAIAIDLEFDPEDDLTQQGDRSVNFLVQAKAAVFDCVNAGAVTGKKDNAGGITGRMDLGRVQACESYGDVASTDGSYVGGIAGSSRGMIQDCWSKCTLSGSHYIGGIAGLGSTLSDCRSAVEISRGNAYLGAVAGTVEEDRTVNGNLFTSDTLAAIDGISYAGKAEPADFETLCALPGAPEDFAQITLTFVADGETVEVITVPYGGSVTALPDIPAKEGCSAAWPELDYGNVTASCTVDAVYTPYTSALTDGGELPEILVDGSFSSGAQVSHNSREETWTDREGKEYQGTVWTVTVTDPELEEVSYTIHCRLPEEGKSWQLWVKGEDGWQRQDSTIDGSYLLLKGTGETTVFCILPQPFPMALVVVLILVLVLAAGVVILLVRRRRRIKVRA